MLDIKTLLPELKKLVTSLSEDLLARSTENAGVDAGLREAYKQIEKGGRTADPFEVWREDYLDQVAVAWVLACVFVRFMEDNHLIDECWLAGEGERRKLAEDTHELYFRAHPHETDREYFEHIFHEVGKIPACRDLFAVGKTPLWAVGPSGDTAMKLLGFWREMNPESGHLKRSFEVEKTDTRFLGDLYQDLSERARKKYALLQTPVFVEEFILDRTLNPAIDEFGLDEVRMIDPTCGSGHFLLGAFARLFDLWMKREDNEVAAAQEALDGVWGVDINPFAVAIARFRLIVAALRACAIKRLKDAPAWDIHLATGDSLLFGNRWTRDGEKKSEQQFLGTEEESWAPEIYACEDKEAISEVLGQQYHAVVGNPPYIIVRDRVLNAAYRIRYSSCGGKYSLGVPFTQRFWELAVHANVSHDSSSGYIGQITTNSFMKREFGKKLIEEFLPTVDLTHVIDTSGAYIPGHGTPTVILLGRNTSPTNVSIRAVQGIKGEPSTPEDASQGYVWRSIVHNIDIADSQDEFTSTADVPRVTFANHPWSIGGGGASELKEQIEELASQVLSAFGDIGIGVVTLEDDAYHVSSAFVHRQGIPLDFQRGFVVGDTLRDWNMVGVEPALFPHDRLTFKPVEDPVILKMLWPYKTGLSNRLWFRKTQTQRGLKWYEYGHISVDKYRTPLSIAFAEVATHNHFVLDRGGRVFNQTTPIIKLSQDATEDDHLSLLGLLNSSTACFWLKQVCHNKGSTVDQHGARQRTAPFEDFYQLNGTRVEQFPITAEKPLTLARQMEHYSQELASHLPDQLIRRGTLTSEALEHSSIQAATIRTRMIALQEELDWKCYQLYSLLDESLCYQGDDLPELSLGQRAFEIVMARQMETGELETTWFERHDSTPITEIPQHWPEAYRTLVKRRIELIETNKEIGLTEKPEYKRRWNTESWDDQQQRALQHWLLNRLESQTYWPIPTQHEPRLQSVAELADKASGDHDFLQVAAIYRGREDFDVAALVAELVRSESVPLLPVLRYKATGRAGDQARQGFKTSPRSLPGSDPHAGWSPLKAPASCNCRMDRSAGGLSPVESPTPCWPTH